MTASKISKIKLTQIERIIRIKKLTSEDLDGLVIDTALARATKVNNNGLRAQVDFMLENMTEDNVIKYLQNLPNITAAPIKQIDDRIKNLIGDNKEEENK